MSRSDNKKWGEVLKKDSYLGLCIVGLGLLIYFWLIPLGVATPSRISNPALSPTFWPEIIALLLCFFGLFLTIESLVQTKSKQFIKDAEAAGDSGALIEHGIAWRPAAALFFIIPYYLSVVNLGLLLPSIVAFIAYSFLAGENRILAPVICGVIIPVVITIFFIKAANTLIPLGPLGHLF